LAWCGDRLVEVLHRVIHLWRSGLFEQGMDRLDVEEWETSTAEDADDFAQRGLPNPPGNSLNLVGVERDYRTGVDGVCAIDEGDASSFLDRFV
jgi:hypothetical protein